MVRFCGEEESKQSVLHGPLENEPHVQYLRRLKGLQVPCLSAIPAQPAHEPKHAWTTASRYDRITAVAYSAFFGSVPTVPAYSDSLYCNTWHPTNSVPTPCFNSVAKSPACQ